MNGNANIFESADGKFRVWVVPDHSKHPAGQYFGLISKELKPVLSFTSHNGEVVRIDKDNAWVEVGSRWGYLGYKYACDEAKALVAEYERRAVA